MPRHEALAGLPPYGPPAESFTATGGGAYREGFVVRFLDDQGRQWVGNFGPGLGGLDTVIGHPDGRRVIVISGGQGYIADPEDSSSREYFGGDIDSVIPISASGLIFGNGIRFEAIGPAGRLWTSNRISWDGLRNFEIAGRILTGEAWDPMRKRWVKFDLDVASGRSSGGSFEGHSSIV